ncbi:gamma-aminobutyric acid receptor alpha-like isoform X3 [Anopheles albimanus]|uniref:gamma-aminobutyric acid receptor alpha-like isoform X3 n=1 Tax=Anopheles albimanus TaxID=7167 RepID=UPI0016417BDA|nr:gamma-aminobutyric acid receptor alpha-like isoform X3 [Anopheles albimanus]
MLLHQQEVEPSNKGSGSSGVEKKTRTNGLNAMAIAHTAVSLVGANLFITINRIILGSFSNIAIGIGTCYFLAPAGPVHAAIRLTQRNNHANISELLDNLLRGYDNSIRPDFGGPPAVIEVDIMVRSMGPISEVDMTYSMDCYFRQSWVDRRLAFSGAQDTLALSISMLGRIWKPDTYFYNGKQSYLHTITTPNKFVRLYQDGRVLYSSRLTIKAGCPMNLEDFPMDTQRCPLKFGSSEYSMLLVSFHLQRHMGNFLIQVYGPCVLLVVLSWVSFWLNREATADRVSLGITTVLTMTFLGLEARTDLPKVPYPTALDFFVFLSFAFIFATIIQFAIVHYFTKYGSGECYFSVEELTSSSDDEDDSEQDPSEPNGTTSAIRHGKRCSAITSISGAARRDGDASGDSRYVEVIPLSVCSFPMVRKSPKPSWTEVSCFGGSVDDASPTAIGGSYRTTSTTITATTSSSLMGAPLSAVAASGVVDMATTSFGGKHRRRTSGSGTTRRGQQHITIDAPSTPISAAPNVHRSRRRRKRAPRFNSVSKIDRASRIFFPLLFLAINVFYWCLYLSRSERIPQPHQKTG